MVDSYESRLPQRATADDAAPRPKVMRRPTNFAPKSSELAPVDALPISPTIVSPQPHQPRAWQDDGRFAFALFVVVIVINLLIGAWLNITPHTPPAIVTIAAPVGRISEPAAPNTDDISVFANPTAQADENMIDSTDTLRYVPTVHRLHSEVDE